MGAREEREVSKRGKNLEGREEDGRIEGQEAKEVKSSTRRPKKRRRKGDQTHFARKPRTKSASPLIQFWTMGRGKRGIGRGLDVCELLAVVVRAGIVTTGGICSALTSKVMEKMGLESRSRRKGWKVVM